MKISFHLKYLVAGIMLSQMAYTSEPTVEDLAPEKSASTVQSQQAEEITKADPDVPVTQPIPCFDYYLVNPIKAAGKGIVAGFLAPIQGFKEFSYAVRGIEPYEITKEDNTVESGINNLTTGERWYKARQGAVYTFCAPLVALAGFMINLQELNHPNGGL